MDWQKTSNALLQTYIETEPVGLITDVDGTISPIVSHPDDAAVTDRARHLLTDLSTCLALVGVISGRAAADVHQRVGVSGLIYIGNHGLEQWVDGRVEPAPGVEKYRPALEAAIAEINRYDVPGMWIEDKQATLSVHYRQSPDPDRIAEQYRPIMDDIAQRCDLRFFEGRRIFELRPPLEMNKGTAFRSLVEAHNLSSAMYIGDDVTDIDALLAARQMRQSGDCFAVAVGVESDHMPPGVGDSSDFLVEGVHGVESLLAWVSNACKASST